MTRLSLRSHYWGALRVVVAAGALDGHTAPRLLPYVRKHQAGNDLVLDLWDVTQCDSEGIAAVNEAKTTADQAGWGFALVVDPSGPCAKAFQKDDVGRSLPTFEDRQAARAALQGLPRG